MTEENTLAAAFVRAVEEGDDRLVSDFHLERGEPKVVGPNEVTVTFRGDRARLILDCNRGELDALFEPRGDGPGSTLKLGKAFQLRLVLGVQGVAEGRTRWPRIIGRETADRSVELIVDDIVAHAGPWLRGEEEAFRRLAEFRDIETGLKMAQFGPGRRSSDAWRPVKEAWESQDLAALEEALEELDAPLRDVERQALEYAGRWRGEEE